MINYQLAKIGQLLGLGFREDSQFPSQYNKHIVVFDGVNGQRFLIDGNEPDNIIYKELGNALITMGRRMQKMEINQALSITSD